MSALSPVEPLLGVKVAVYELGFRVRVAMLINLSCKARPKQECDCRIISMVCIGEATYVRKNSRKNDREPQESSIRKFM